LAYVVVKNRKNVIVKIVNVLFYSVTVKSDAITGLSCLFVKENLKLRLKVFKCCLIYCCLLHNIL